MSSRLGPALITVSVTIALPLLSVAPASAFAVAVDSIGYDVTIFNGSYNGDPALFRAPHTGMVPGKRDVTLALKFALQD